MLFDCAQIALFAAALLAAGPGVMQRLGAAFFVTGAFILSWYAPGTPFARGLLAGLAVWSLIVVVKLAFPPAGRQSVHHPRLQVIRLMMVLPDSLRATRKSAIWSWRDGARSGLHLILAGVALVVLLHTRQLMGTAHYLGRLGAAMVFIYAGVQFLFDGARAGLRAIGLSWASLHRTPIAARSVADFWGHRWNRLVSAWLYDFVFLPLARRRRPRLGIFGAFLVSGLLHAWFIFVAIGVAGAFTTVLFFTMQGVFVLVEHRLHLHTWPVPLARAWTVALLLVSAPLFVDPCLKIFGL